MKLTPATNPALAAIDAATKEHAESLHAAVHALNRAYWALWNLSDEELVSLLNGLGPERVGLVMATHNSQALALNAALEAALSERPKLAERLAVRAITVPARNLQWDVEGNTFVVIPEPEPEPDPEPEE